jgi:DnaJ-class molecular chaperone
MRVYFINLAFDPLKDFNKASMKCRTRILILNVTLEDIYNGTSKIFEYSRRVVCGKCSGSGIQDKLRQICSKCTGSGVIIHISFGFNFKQKCTACKGEGLFISDKCNGCNGEQVTYILATTELKLDKGVDIDHRYFYPAMGDEYPDKDTGDIYVEMVIEKHKLFRRMNSDLVYNCRISLLEALTGCSIIVKHLNGRYVKLEYKGIVSPGDNKKVVYNFGLPVLGNSYLFGRLIIVFEIVFPDQLDDTQIKSLKSVFDYNGETKNNYEVKQIYNLSACDYDELISDEETEDGHVEEINFEFINEDKDICLNQ